MPAAAMLSADDFRKSRRLVASPVWPAVIFFSTRTPMKNPMVFRAKKRRVFEARRFTRIKYGNPELLEFHPRRETEGWRSAQVGRDGVVLKRRVEGNGVIVSIREVRSPCLDCP